MAGAHAVREFWLQVEASNDKRLDNHPMKWREDWREKTIPLFVHGDGVEYHDRDSLMVFSYGSLLSVDGALCSCLLYAAIPKSCTLEGTWSPVHARAHQSWVSCLNGKVRLPSGIDAWVCKEKYSFVVWMLVGDAEYFCNTLGLPHWSCHRPCWECNCDTRDDKTWRQLQKPLMRWQEFSLQEYLNQAPHHEFFQLPGAPRVGHDMLHVLYCKGVLAHLLGSVLHTLCYQEGRGRQASHPADRLAIVFTKVQESYKENETQTRLVNLKLKMFCNPDAPHAYPPFLNCKGAEGKHLLPALLWVMRTMSDGSEFHLRIIAAMDAIYKFTQLIDTSGYVLNADEATRAVTLVENFLGHYGWLREYAADQGTELFHVVLKFHMLFHLAAASKHLIPRL